MTNNFPNKIQRLKTEDLRGYGAGHVIALPWAGKFREPFEILEIQPDDEKGARVKIKMDGSGCKAAVEWRKLAYGHEFEVYRPVGDIPETNKEVIARCAKYLDAYFPWGTPAIPLTDIERFARLISGYYWREKLVGAACRLLAKQGKLVVRGSIGYRRPLAGWKDAIGCGVITKRMDKSADYGWITKFVDHRIVQVRTIKGKILQIEESKLDLLNLNYQEDQEAQEIIIAQQSICAGQTPEGYVFLSDAVLEQAAAEHWDLAAKAIGIWPDKKINSAERSKLRSQTICWLNTYYPGWRSGEPLRIGKPQSAVTSVEAKILVGVAV